MLKLKYLKMKKWWLYTIYIDKINKNPGWNELACLEGWESRTDWGENKYLGALYKIDDKLINPHQSFYDYN